MKKQNEKSSMVTKQTLYMAILVSITFGFMVGAVYTSFKLAGAGPEGPAGKTPAGMAQNQAAADHAEAQAGARILELESFLKENPENAEAWVQLGNTFFDTHRFVDAIEAYEKSLSLAPGNPNVLTDLGVMYRRNKQSEKAIESFDRAIAAQPDFEIARFNKGIVLMHDLNDLAGAVKTWEALVEINPMAKAPSGELLSVLIKGLKDKAK